LNFHVWPVQYNAVAAGVAVRAQVQLGPRVVGGAVMVAVGAVKGGAVRGKVGADLCPAVALGARDRYPVFEVVQ
jgi:hypothetical protein